DRTVVIAGDNAGVVACQVAQAHQWPLVAEATSGAHHGDTVVAHGPELLDSRAGEALAREVHQVVVIGRPTLTRAVTRLVDAAPALVVAQHEARWREATRH